MRGWTGVLLLGVLALAAPARAQFSVSPAQLAVGGEGATATEVLVVRNEGEQPLQLRFYVGDFDQSEDGDPQLLPLGEHASTCAGRLQVFPEGAVLAAGERQEVRVTMAPGPSVCWSVVYAEAASSTSGQVRVSQRIAVKAFGLAPDLSADAELTDVTVTQSADVRRVHVRLLNKGEAPLRPAGRLEIRDFAGELVGTVPIEPFTVLPKQPRRFAVALPAELRAGQYLAVPILDFGADYLVGGQARFEVK